MKTENLNDQELVRAFINGDESKIDTLISRHRTKVYTYIFLTVKNHALAEDLFQETFIKVIKSLRNGKYRDNGKFISWVIRIAHNLVIDHFRKEKQLHIISNDDSEIDLLNSKKLSDENIEQLMVNHQVKKDLRRLVNELPEDQKEVVLLRHFGELSFKEIADHTGVSINTALGRMRYALINLRKMISERNLSLLKA